MNKKRKPFLKCEGKKQYDRHVRITKNMMFHNNYISLSPTAKELYLYMKMWSNGNYASFEFPFSIVTKNKIMTKSTFYKNRDILVDRGFIEYTRLTKASRLSNKYKLSDKWIEKI